MTPPRESEARDTSIKLLNEWIKEGKTHGTFVVLVQKALLEEYERGVRESAEYAGTAACHCHTEILKLLEQKDVNS